ncbi:MAG: hypothetical protein MK207_03925 [Saprospiraceae bacterium]|nr:hypothetical protein [Saprospiraceae bacterium]
MEKRQESVGENTRQYDARGNQRENPLCPEDYYPVYWGYYEYDNETRESHYDLEIDVKNNKRVKGFIHKWVEQHLDGIRLKSDVRRKQKRYRTR